MSLSISAHRVDKIKLTPIQEYARSTGEPFWSQDLIIESRVLDGDGITRISIFYDRHPAVCLDGDIVSNEPMNLEIKEYPRPDVVEDATHGVFLPEETE